MLKVYKLYSSNELQINDNILFFDYNIESLINSKQKGIIILDLSRKIEEPDLKRFAAKIVLYNTLQEKYEIEKFNIVLGEL